MVWYSFSWAATAGEWRSVATRLQIDGAAADGTEALQGAQNNPGNTAFVVYGTNQGFYMGTLAAGPHTIDVQYSTSATTIVSRANTDSEVRILRVLVL